MEGGKKREASLQCIPQAAFSKIHSVQGVALAVARNCSYRGKTCGSWPSLGLFSSSFWTTTKQKRTSEPLLYNWCLPASVCESVYINQKMAKIVLFSSAWQPPTTKVQNQWMDPLLSLKTIDNLDRHFARHSSQVSSERTGKVALAPPAFHFAAGTFFPQTNPTFTFTLD